MLNEFVDNRVVQRTSFPGWSLLVGLSLFLAGCAGGTAVSSEFHEVGSQVPAGEPGQDGPGGEVADSTLVFLFSNLADDGSTAIVTAEGGFQGFCSFPGCYITSMALPVPAGAEWEVRLFRGQVADNPPLEAAFHVMRSQPGLTAPANGMRILELTITQVGAALTANRLGSGEAPEPDGPIPDCP